MAVTIDGTNGITSPDFEPSSSTTPTNGLFLPAANTVGLATGSTERLRIDSSGNLGLGVTPSAWSSAFKVFQGYGGFLASNGSAVQIAGANAYSDGTNWRYIATAAASFYAQVNGVHSWSTAPSGTAGNAISFTQAMTLDASGNLGIGTTSPGGKLDVSGGYSYLYGLRISGNDTGNTIYQNAAIGISSGNYITFSTNSAGPYERARIDSSGNLLVGTTSSAGSYLFQISGNFSGSYGQLVKSSASSGYMISFNTSSGQAGYISSSGTSTSYVASSDQRLKENIVDAPSALGSINAIKVRSFDWKSDGSHVDYGYIAQELLEVVPEAVSVHEDPEQMMGVDFGKLTPRLVKAIQELTARLEALEAK